MLVTYLLARDQFEDRSIWTSETQGEMYLNLLGKRSFSVLLSMNRQAVAPVLTDLLSSCHPMSSRRVSLSALDTGVGISKEPGLTWYG